ncbi:FAD-binding oxidoreductase, partial [bacterium]
MLASPWFGSDFPSYPPLEADEHVDVVVVGGGITGITTAYFMAREGRRVALIERDRLACGDTGNTTAHLTYVTDSRLNELASRFGDDAARAFWEAGAAAIDLIASNVREREVDCDFRWTPGYLHEPSGLPASGKERDALMRDAALAERFGFDAQFLESVPGVGRPGVRFGGQAALHPRKYLAALLQGVEKHGGRIFENTAFDRVEEGPLRVRANGHEIRCDYLVIATHTPLMGKQVLVGVGRVPVQRGRNRSRRQPRAERVARIERELRLEHRRPDQPLLAHQRRVGRDHEVVAADLVAVRPD